MDRCTVIKEDIYEYKISGWGLFLGWLSKLCLSQPRDYSIKNGEIISLFNYYIQVDTSWLYYRKVLAQRVGGSSQVVGYQVLRSSQPPLQEIFIAISSDYPSLGIRESIFYFASFTVVINCGVVI